VLTNVFTGRPARALVNRFIREVGPIANAAPAFPIPLGVSAPLRILAEQRGSADFTPLWSGQASPLGREMPAKALTTRLVTETMQQFRRLSATAEELAV
jgi:nitronate monooxygenase